MTSHSDSLTWRENWDYLLRCFPSVDKAPDPAKEQFHQRMCNLKQRWVREAITLALNKHTRRYLTLDHLLGFYQEVLPPEPEEPKTRHDAFVVDYWVFPARMNERVGQYRTLPEARAAARTLPGSRVHARWCRPGDNGWYQDLDADETLATPEQETEVLCRMYALMAKSITNRDSTFEYTYQRLSSLPPSHSPPQGSTRASERGEAESEAPSRVVHPDKGVCQPPLEGRNYVDGMTMPKYPLPPHLELQVLELRLAELEQKNQDSGDSDGAPPHEAGIACAAPGENDG